MSYLPFALLAYLFNSISVLTDKFLLSKKIPNPFLYVFYTSVLSLLTLLAFPWTQKIGLFSFIQASASTLLWTGGAYYMFKSLQVGVASRVIPVIGTLIPVILFGQAYFSGSISIIEVWAVGFLIFGLLFLVIPAFRGKFKSEELLMEVVSSFFFANSYIILKMAYSGSDFLTVLVFSKLILLPLCIIVFLIPSFRKIVISKKQEEKPLKLISKSTFLFLGGQASGALSQFLLLFSISLAQPALVNSLQGIQYFFLFVFSLILAKFYPHVFAEKTSRLNILGKISGLIFILTGLFLLSNPQQKAENQKLGMSFSPRYAQELGLNPKDIYVRSIKELGIKRFRIPVYWDDVEKKEGKVDLSSQKFYFDEARKRGIEIIAVVGLKQPRWPECYMPGWAAGLPKEKLQQKIINLVKNEVSNLKEYSNITTWQVENEPFLSFGRCPYPTPLTPEFLKTEINEIKKIDSRPVMITDSGELSTWINAFSLSDQVGTTMYREVWNPYIGHVHYPWPPQFYPVKSYIVKKLTGKPNEHLIVSELQTEPWVPGIKTIMSWDINEQIKVFPKGEIESNIKFAKQTNLDQIYLWGVEWWYWMEKNGHPEYLDEAKKTFISN